MVEFERTTDVAVVGSGIGGLAAAIVLSEAGRDVVVLEKGTTVGGTSGISGGELWIPCNHLQSTNGVDDSVEEGVAYLEALSGDLYADEPRIRRYVERGREAVEYFESEIDFSVQIIENFQDYEYPGPGAKPEGRYLEPIPFPGDQLGEWNDLLPRTPHFEDGITHNEMFSWGGKLNRDDWDWDRIESRQEAGYRTFGPGMLAYFLDAVLEREIPLELHAEVTDIVLDDRAVGGLQARIDGTDVGIRTRLGVVLNTGAYDWSPGLVESLDQIPAEQTASAGVPYCTGDGLRMAGNAGAKLAVYPPIANAKPFILEVPERDFLDGPLYTWAHNAGLPHAVVVGAHGRRFTDGSYYRKSMRDVYDPTGEYDHLPCYMVFDDQYASTYPLGRTYDPGEAYPDDFLAGKADDLGSLADELGISPGTLEETVRRFNDHARAGEDPDFGRGENKWANKWAGDPNHEPNPNLGPLEEPPYYAVRLYVGLSGMSTTGLVTDEHGRVLDWNDETVDGLYAVGSVCAPLEWGIGYQSGVQNGRSLLYGYLAGRHLARTD